MRVYDALPKAIPAHIYCGRKAEQDNLYKAYLVGKKHRKGGHLVSNFIKFFTSTFMVAKGFPRHS